MTTKDEVCDRCRGEFDKKQLDKEYKLEHIHWSCLKNYFKKEQDE